MSLRYSVSLRTSTPLHRPVSLFHLFLPHNYKAAAANTETLLTSVHEEGTVERIQ
jgi:hypothetical protein